MEAILPCTPTLPALQSDFFNTHGRYHTFMLQSLSSFFPTADDLLKAEMWRLGLALLIHIKSHEGSSSGVYQNGLASYTNLLAYQNHIGKPEYGDKQPLVDGALSEAWNWLQRKGLVIRDESQPAAWFRISRDGEEFLRQKGRIDQWEKLGVARVKSDLESGGLRDVGGPLEARNWAWKWVGMKEAAKAAEAVPAAVELTVISANRLDELRAVASTKFDFRKLIRLCEEINITYENECYLATAMLTRALLDHVPPIFGVGSFTEVANNYDGGKSFKGAMQHLQNGLRNVADGHLHQQIRNSESIPTAQQVNFAASLDMLLSEVVRILR
jgi:hypothetical protein